MTGRGERRYEQPVSGKIFWSRYAIGLDELDIGGVVYHAHYLKICDRVRNDAFALGGGGFQTLWDDKLVFAVVEARQWYLKPVRLESVYVATQVIGAGPASLEVRHALCERELSSDGDELDPDPKEWDGCRFHARVRLVLVSLSTGWPHPLPAPLLAALCGARLP